MKRTRTLLFTGDKTTKTSASYQTIEKDYQELKTFTKKQNIPKISQEKRQLLIENAFERIYKRTSLSQEQGIDLCNNDQICP